MISLIIIIALIIHQHYDNCGNFSIVATVICLLLFPRIYVNWAHIWVTHLGDTYFLILITYNYFYTLFVQFIVDSFFWHRESMYAWIWQHFSSNDPLV